MDPNPYSAEQSDLFVNAAGEAAADQPRKRRSLSRQILSATFLGFGLVTTFGTLMAIAILSDRIGNPRLSWWDITVSGSISVVLFWIAHRLQR